jgi:hypothetical protein
MLYRRIMMAEQTGTSKDTPKLDRRWYLRATTDPVLRALLEAPLDDEPETEEERQAVHEAREELARGEVRTLEEVRRELGR